MEREELIKMWLAGAPKDTRESYESLADFAPSTAFHVLQEWSEGQVWCPHCHVRYPLDFCDGDGDLCTYHGEDGAIEKECSKCGEVFFVVEHVQRTYTSGKTAAEAEG